jgi:prepilin-type N-terminal cleavage/methylation domain-containing protein
MTLDLHALRSSRTRRRAAFTLIELLVVIAIIGIIAGLALGVGTAANKKKNRSRAKAELERLVTVIERYKADFGHYPPDNPNTNAPNQLFYELMGTVHNPGASPGTGNYSTKDGRETISEAGVAAFFNVGGFINTGGSASQVKSYFPSLSESQYAEISSNPDVEVLKGPVRGNSANELTDVEGRPVNPWRYNSSNPTHNKNSFDLWIEVKIGNDIEIIGNWK